MAEVRFRLCPGAGSLWMMTPCFLAFSKKRFEVFAVTRVIHSYSILSGRCINISRSYRTSSTEEIPLYHSKSAYYDILQVSQSATQAQIKTAYYKQSFIYHPDKNAGSDHATSRFSQINEAYNVLGNKALRKKYDAGILREADIRGSSRPSARKETMRGPLSDTTRNRQSPRVGVHSQKIFDFDSFYRAHYSEQLQRDKQIRARLEEIKRQKKGQFQVKKLGRMSEIAVGLMLVVAAGILFSIKLTK